MNKRDLVNIIAKRVNLPKQDIEEVITLVFNKIIEEVDINQIVRLRDFGIVMKDGFIQQVDSPTELYDNPVNTFVAGFIGMPPMNFIEGLIAVEGSDVYVTFENISVKLPERYSVEEGMERDGQQVIFGVRPEAVTDETTFVSD